MLTRRKPIRKVSKKHAKELSLYHAAARQFKKDNPQCCLCDRPTDDVHHIRKRGKYQLDQNTWVPVCRSHHEIIHRFPGEARRMGLLE